MRAAGAVHLVYRTYLVSASGIFLVGHREPDLGGYQMGIWLKIIKPMRGAARLEKYMWGKRRRTRILTKVDNAFGISLPGHGLCSHFKVATL